ncbi:MAG: hypothetical protein LLG04_17715 [Parachlamydia sp.]|nr:hypothetical protein [Parachlamydia sp.]
MNDETVLEDFETGKIHFRDKWQFELKSDLYPFSEHKKNNLVQEFYFFIPNSLQINDQTYSKAQFYLDQTNLIRLKTPRFSLGELLDPLNKESPLVRIRMLLNNSAEASRLQQELKILGRVFHSSLRNWTALLKSNHGDSAMIAQGCEELERLLSQFRTLQNRAAALPLSKELLAHFHYVDEYLSLTVNDYLTQLLDYLRKNRLPEANLPEVILNEKRYREELYLNSHPAGLKDEELEEYILYRKGLLNKFVIDPLLLKTSRASADQRYRTIIGAIPAAIAMFIFLILYVLQGSWFLINSEPFILFTVLIYVLKDRLKEELRFVSFRQVAKWFSDYTTEIQDPQNDEVMGYLKEYASFIDSEKIPSEISEIRNQYFHKVLEVVKRPERVLYYKKTVSFEANPGILEERFYGYNIFFRFDIHHFLAKAEDPFQTYLTLDEKTQNLCKIELPRVYHLNIIMKSRTFLPDGTPKEELNKYRLVLDKMGIKRVEEVTEYHP